MKKTNRLDLLFFSIALLTTGVGLLFWWFAGQINILSCIRPAIGQVDCQVQRQFLGVLPVSQRSIPQVTGVEMHESCPDDCVYWLEFLTENGPVRLSPISNYDWRQVEADQVQIEAFFNQPALQFFEMTGPPAWLLFFAGIPLIGVGCWLSISYGKTLFQ